MQAVPDVLVDSLVQEILEKIVQLGYDEVILPPSTNEFSEKKMGITWSGSLVLTNGKFRGLSTIHRTGEAQVGFNENAEMTFTVDLGLTNPTTIHDFLLIFLKRELEGVVNSTMTYVTFTMVLGVGLLSRKLRLIKFKFKELGDVNAEVTGLGTIMDYLASKITNIAINRIKWEVATDVEAEMQRFLSEIINGSQWPTSQTPTLVVKEVRKRTIN